MLVCDECRMDLNRIEGEFLQAFMRDGELEPVCAIITGGRIVDAIPVLNDRAAFTSIVRRICREIGADTVVVYAEAWAAKDSPGSPRPSMRHDRQELLMAYTETAESATVRAWPIVRIARGALAGPRVLLGDVFTMNAETGAGLTTCSEDRRIGVNCPIPDTIEGENDEVETEICACSSEPG